MLKPQPLRGNRMTIKPITAFVALLVLACTLLLYRTNQHTKQSNPKPSPPPAELVQPKLIDVTRLSPLDPKATTLSVIDLEVCFHGEDEMNKLINDSYCKEQTNKFAVARRDQRAQRLKSYKRFSHPASKNVREYQPPVSITNSSATKRPAATSLLSVATAPLPFLCASTWMKT